MKKHWKKIAIALAVLVVVFASASIYANYWVDHKLPELINKKNKSGYSIAYKDIDISLLSRSLALKEVVVVPKDSLKEEKNGRGIYARIEGLEVSGIGIFNAVFRDEISASSLTVDKPELTLYTGHKKSDKTKPRNLRDDVVSPFRQVISVSKIIIKNGNGRIVDIRKNKESMRVKNFDLSLDGIEVDSVSLKKKIPFNFDRYAFSCDGFFYKPKGFYHIASGKMSLTNTDFSASDFEYLCDLNRSAYDKALQTERDLYNIKVKKIAISGIGWKLDKKDQLSAEIAEVHLSKPNANIYRNKLVADDFRKKKLYSQLLRELKFDLDLKKLTIAEATLEYEEKVSERGPGKLRFSPFYLTATNLQSGRGKTKVPNVNIEIKAQFMDVSPLNVKWTFNPLDKSDGFRIHGSIVKFPVERLRGFMKPYLNFEGEGTLEKVLFDYRGNDEGAGGKFAVEYDDLKFKAFQKKNPEKKSKVMTAVANLLVKKDSKERLKNAEVNVEREKHKSFYNLFWKCMQDGLTQTLLII